jgi:hypothetical protein
VSGEQINKTRHPKIFIGAVDSYSDERISRILTDLESLARHDDAGELRLYLNRVLPEANIKAPDEGEIRKLKSARATLRPVTDTGELRSHSR